jgi:inner membrane protein
VNIETQDVKAGIRNISNSITVKILSIGVLILALLIPAEMIHSIIREREVRHQQVVAEVSDKWGREQIVAGPVLSIPYKVYRQDEEGGEKSRIRTLYMLPEELSVSGTLEPESRNRGIYEVIVYTAKLDINGAFEYPDFTQFQIPEQDIVWSDITLSVGISDMKGISEDVLITWGELQLPVEPGVNIGGTVESGIHTDVLLAKNPTDRSLPFDFSLNLKGSERIQFIPVGKTTNLDLTSSWAHPSFTGEFLPDQRNISPDGFQAHWTVFHLNWNIAQTWIDNNSAMEDWAFGVQLFLPADEYQQTTRSAKYAILFIVLTFALFFLMEVSGKQRVHPIQYLLVGLALCIFYILLISISEHLGFTWSYLVSALAVIGMVGLYSKSVLPGKKQGLLVGGNVAVLYGYLYFILQLQDYALLIGSLGLFAILSLIMYFTRNFDWYAIDLLPGKKKPEKQEHGT